MQTAKQFSVRLVNRPGRLAAVLAALAKEKVELLALSVMDSGDQNTLRFVPDDPGRTRIALQTMNVKHDTAEVLLADLNSRNGSFRKVCERLASQRLNIDYAYGSHSNGKSKGGSLAVIKVNDLVKAQRVLSQGATGTRQRAKPVRRLRVRAK